MVIILSFLITFSLDDILILFGEHCRGTQRQFLENMCSEDDLRSRIFGTFVVKFLACPPPQGFSNPPKNDIIAHF